MFDTTMLGAAMIVAQEDTTATGGSLLGLLLPLLILGGIFYFLFYMPQRRRMRAQQQLRDSIQVGDEVRTIGGLLGTVRSIDDGDVVSLEIAPGTVIRITKRAIATRSGDPGADG